MANVIQNFVRTGSLIGNDGSGTIEKTAGYGRTLCTNCHKATASRNLKCQHCPDIRTPRSEIQRFTYNPRKPRKPVATIHSTHDITVNELAYFLVLLAKNDSVLANFLAS